MAATRPASFGLNGSGQQDLVKVFSPGLFLLGKNVPPPTSSIKIVKEYMYIKFGLTLAVQIYPSRLLASGQLDF